MSGRNLTHPLTVLDGMRAVRLGASAVLLLLFATACGSDDEEVSPPSDSAAAWLCEEDERTFSAVDPSKPPGGRTLAEALALRLKAPYNIVEQARGVALVQTFADDSVTGEYRFVRWRETKGGWYMETAEECK